MNQLAPPLILRRAVIIRRENDGRVEWGVFTGFYLQQIARSVWNFGGVSSLSAMRVSIEEKPAFSSIEWIWLSENPSHRSA